MRDVDDLKRKLRTKTQAIPLTGKDFLSTGSTLLNLACTGRPRWGFAKGHYFWLAGDSTSGKTFLTLTCFAEAMRNSNFKDYRLIFDNPEQGALMDITKYFGNKVAKRIENPTKKGLGFSTTVEEFYYNVDDAFLKDEPFIYVLDSHDALDSDSSEEKFQEQKTAHRKGKQAAGSYGDGKAKINSQNIRKVASRLKKSGSILILISQTRDNLGFGFEKKTVSGGRSLKFYATMQMWSSVKSKLKKGNRSIGVECQVQIKKNRFIGKDRTVTFPIYHSHGIDDVGGMVDFLVSEKHWTSKTINAPELEISMKREKLIQHIEKNGLERDVQDICHEVWTEIEDSLVVKRKPRYE